MKPREMFSIRTLDQKSHPFIRGHNVLRALLALKSPSGGSVVNRVYSLPGHIGVVLQSWTTCVVLDAVPSSLHVPAPLQEQAIQCIKERKGLPSECPIFVSFHSSPIALLVRVRLPLSPSLAHSAG